MRQRIEKKPTKSLQHGGSSVNVDRFDILIRPHGASVSLALSASYLGLPTVENCRVRMDARGMLVGSSWWHPILHPLGEFLREG